MITSGVPASTSVTWVPTTPMPASRSNRAVRTSPGKPWSRLWLDAVVARSQPMVAIHAAICGGAAKDG
ncbi:Uncharacterised protein [Mycobacteroides abscessus subsp. abscessus]|nr:Uncharacterised protein [Mycobacteroides abscessus subsp. abscessus]